MKKIVRSITLLFTSLLSLFGIQKAKTALPESDRKSRVARQRVIMLDEHELSAYHNN